MTKLLIDLGLAVGQRTCIRNTLGEGFCPMIRTERFGLRWSCHLFQAVLVDVDGRLQRLPECMEADTYQESEDAEATP